MRLIRRPWDVPDEGLVKQRSLRHLCRSCQKRHAYFYHRGRVQSSARPRSLCAVLPNSPIQTSHVGRSGGIPTR